MNEAYRMLGLLGLVLMGGQPGKDGTIAAVITKDQASELQALTYLMLDRGRASDSYHLSTRGAALIEREKDRIRAIHPGTGSRNNR